MEGRLDGTKMSHRLTAARLLTTYGYDDAPNFIADNTPETSETESGEKMWVTMDPVLKTLIKAMTDDGRVICMFLIDVMEGGVEGVHVGHRVAAAKELLDRAFGKSRRRDLPGPHGSNSPRRQTRKTQQRVAPARSQPAPAAQTVKTAVMGEPEQQPEPEPNRGIDRDVDSVLYEFMNECEAPDFDPYLAAIDEEYFRTYTGCKDPQCMVHGEPLEIDFNPNDYHY